MNNRYQSFEDLRIWKEAMSLCVDVYHAMKGCKEFGLRDQLQKSAMSIPSNIAEGYERQTDKEFIRFLYIAKASSGELRTQLLVAISIQAIQHDLGDALFNKAKKVSGMIQYLIKARRKLVQAKGISRLFDPLIPLTL